MTYPAPTETTVPGRPDRPGSVTVAAACFWLAALILLAQAAQVIFDLVTMDQLTRQAGAATSASPAEVRTEINSAHLFDVFSLLVVVALAGGVALVAVRFRRGSHVARVVGTVLAGVVMLCCGGALVASIIGNRQPEASEFQRQLTQLARDRTPDWVSYLTLAALLVYPLLIAACVLLLVPTSNRYFRPFAGYYVYPVDPPPGS